MPTDLGLALGSVARGMRWAPYIFICQFILGTGIGKPDLSVGGNIYETFPALARQALLKKRKGHLQA